MNYVLETRKRYWPDFPAGDTPEKRQRVRLEMFADLIELEVPALHMRQDWRWRWMMDPTQPPILVQAFPGAPAIEARPATKHLPAVEAEPAIEPAPAVRVNQYVCDYVFHCIDVVLEVPRAVTFTWEPNAGIPESNRAVTFIYGLYDPRQPLELRVIGATRQALQCRLATYITKLNHRQKHGLPLNQIYAWLAELTAAGVRPAISLVRTCPTDRWRAIEKQQIRLHRRNGCRLLNIMPGGNGGCDSNVKKSICEKCGGPRKQWSNGKTYCPVCRAAGDTAYSSQHFRNWPSVVAKRTGRPRGRPRKISISSST